VNACAPLKPFVLLLFLATAMLTQVALGEEAEFAITLHNHKFEPAELNVPVGVRVKLVIENLDSSAEEFDSFALNREKIIFPNAKGIVFVGPLKPGRYEFIGEFNRESAHGALIAQ
jgi:hypothetical protein